MYKALLKKILKAKIFKNFKGIVMYKIPVFVTMITIVATVVGCSIFGGEKPPKQILVVKAASIHRIVSRVEENKGQLQDILYKWKKIKTAEHKDEKSNASFQLLLDKYIVSRKEIIKNLMMYLSLDLEENKHLYRSVYGELPADLMALIEVSKKQISDVQSELEE